MSGSGGGQRRRKPKRSSGGGDKLEELDVTKEELDGIGAALKDEQFRKLLCEYAEEIADPANRAQREREMQRYELERGVRLTFVRPRPGFVVKTSADGERKVFVNICSDDVVAEPSCRPDAGGQRWSLPHCLSPVRRDYDRARKPCDVYDVVFHPRVLQLAGHARFRDMVEDTALSMVERTDSVVLDRVNVKYPKNVSYKGVPRSLALRAPIAGFTGPSSADADADAPDRVADMPGWPPVVDRRPVEHHDLGALPQKCRAEPAFAVPAYVIKYRSAVDMGEHGYDMHCKMNATVPNELVVEIKLPLLDTSADLAMDVWPRRLKLVCHKPSRYALDVGLPYTVREEHGRARFDRSARLLTVVLPVLRTEPPLVAGHGRPVGETVDERPAAEEPCGDSDGTAVTSDVTSAVTSAVTSSAVTSAVTSSAVTSSAVTFSAVEDDTVADDDDVHYSLPEHELTFGDGKCILRLNAKNVDPTSVTVAYDAHSVSGKFQSIGSGFFPVWYAFCLEMPSETTIAPSDVRVSPSDDNVTIEFSAPDDSRQRCRYGLPDRNRGLAAIREVRTAVETRQDNSTSLTNDAATVVSVAPEDDSDDDVDNNVKDNNDDAVVVNNNNLVDNNNDVDNNNNDNDEDDDDDDDHDGKDGDDVFVDTKETAPLKDRQQNGKKKDGNYRLKNGKTTKETGKKKNRKKMQKSNAIPIAVAGSLPETCKKVDFVPGSLPTEFNCTRPTIVSVVRTPRRTIEVTATNK